MGNKRAALTQIYLPAGTRSRARRVRNGRIKPADRRRARGSTERETVRKR